VSRWLRVSTVLAAGAFVVGFRAHTSSENPEPAAAAATLNAARVSALESDAPAKPGIRVSLADVAAVPALQNEPKSVVEARAKQAKEAKLRKERAKRRAERLKKQRAARRKRAAARRKRAAAARKRAPARTPVVVTPPRKTTPRVVATPVPTPVYRPPTYTPPPKKAPGYVGKDFDSKG